LSFQRFKTWVGWQQIADGGCNTAILPTCLIDETNEDNVSEPVRGFEVAYSG
jgi:hypothetical protein